MNSCLVNNMIWGNEECHLCRVWEQNEKAIWGGMVEEGLSEEPTLEQTLNGCEGVRWVKY